MAKRLDTTIDGYRVEIEPNAERPDDLDCTISKGRFSASLACLGDTGELWCDEKVIPVSAGTIERIAKLYERQIAQGDGR